MKYDGTATDALAVRPYCDFCKQEGRQRPAYADGKTTFGPWAYLCVEHFERYGIGLGVGKGQRILIEPEPRAACAAPAARASTGRQAATPRSPAPPRLAKSSHPAALDLALNRTEKVS